MWAQDEIIRLAEETNVSLKEIKDLLIKIEKNTRKK